MQKCIICSHEFKWKSIINSVCFSKQKGKLICEYCDAIYYPNSATRLIYIFCIAFPAIFNGYINQFNKWWCMLIYLIWIILMIWITPFYAKFNIIFND